MGWSIGFDPKWKRDIGYGVPAYCDHPGCTAEIDRGLSYVCGGEPYGGEFGCGLYFCSQHRQIAGDKRENKSLCSCCYRGRGEFKPSREHPTWINHKLTDESWQQWRDENPDDVAKLQATVNNLEYA